jgi:hypothetical protein
MHREPLKSSSAYSFCSAVSASVYLSFHILKVFRFMQNWHKYILPVLEPRGPNCSSEGLQAFWGLWGESSPAFPASDDCVVSEDTSIFHSIFMWDFHGDFTLCLFVPFSLLSLLRTSIIGSWNDLIYRVLPWLHLHRPLFWIRPHSLVLARHIFRDTIQLALSINYHLDEEIKCPCALLCHSSSLLHLHR